MQVCSDARGATRENFSILSDELFKHLRIFKIDSTNINVEAAMRHAAISTTEVRTTFCSFRLSVHFKKGVGPILFPDEGYDGGGGGYTFSFRDDLEC